MQTITLESLHLTRRLGELHDGQYLWECFVDNQDGTQTWGTVVGGQRGGGVLLWSFKEQND